MNARYNIIWSEVRKSWIAVAENIRGRSCTLGSLLPSFAAILLFQFSYSGAWSAPLGGSVTAGSGTVSQIGNTTTITQTSKNLSLEWSKFGIADGETVTFKQPSASSVAVNRITGGHASQIFGNLNANGQIFLINPNGILFGPGAQVNAAGLIASTLDLKNNADDLTRIFSGSSKNSVTNEGNLHAIGSNGYVALLGRQVTNRGTISTPSGAVALAAGSSVNLTFGDAGLFSVNVDESRFDTLVRNEGIIVSRGGLILMSAGARDSVMTAAVNNTGILDASSLEMQGGKIILSASGADSHTSLSGVLDASSLSSSGGTIAAGGDDLTLAGAKLNVSGGISGGNIHLGDGGRSNDFSDLATARLVSIDQNSILQADALHIGSGGQISIWSDVATDFGGIISARALGGTGNGGSAEVSSSGLLQYHGNTNLLATNGRTGTLLLDPYNVTISGASDTNSGSFTATGTGSNINVATLQTALGSANVTISTGTSGSESGNITLVDPLQWSASTMLTLNAGGAIALNAPLTATASGAGLTLTAGSGQTISATGAVNVNTFRITQGNWIQNTATLPFFSASDFSVAATTASFLRVTGGAGTAGSPYLLSDIYGVQGMGSSATYLAAKYALINDIDATSTANWNAGAGFLPVGTFTGTLQGRNYALLNLTINRPALTTGVGLFSYTQNATVSNISLLNATISGGSNGTGAAVGREGGNSLFTGIVVTGSVTNNNGMANIGGIVGWLGDTATLTNSSSAASVTGNGGHIGGAVGGTNSSTGTTISNTSATGSVSGGTSAGGLMGLNQGAITDSYATGSVTLTSGATAGHLEKPLFFWHDNVFSSVTSLS